MVRQRAIVADFESTMNTKIVHSFSFMPVDFHTDGQMRRGILETIFIQESLNDPVVSEDSSVQSKLGRTLMHGGSARVLPFRTAILEFVYHVMIQGEGNWLGHAIDRDLEIIQATDTRYGTGLFPLTLRSFPHASTIQEWSKISKMCTQHMFTLRCPNFFQEYSLWMTNNGWSCAKFSAKLEDFTRFVRQDHEYKQKHTSAQDVIDLVDVIARAHGQDLIVLEGQSFLISPPVSSWAKPSAEPLCTHA